MRLFIAYWVYWERSEEIVVSLLKIGRPCKGNFGHVTLKSTDMRLEEMWEKEEL